MQGGEWQAGVPRKARSTRASASKSIRTDIHPFLKGNFAPVFEEFISHPCEVIGHVPPEVRGGQYIRNGGNPIYPPDKGRHYHWFDGDGMLHGVYFPDDPSSPPLYTNRHLVTPLLTVSLLLFRSPIPSIALLISPLSSILRIFVAILQAAVLALRARLGVLSVANTNVIWWGKGLGKIGTPQAAADRPLDQRLLATCESGPPLEVCVPELETIGWDRLSDPSTGEDLSSRRGKASWFRKWRLSSIQEDWMTAHPRIDPIDGSLILYSTQMFDAPHVRYSVIDRDGRHLVWKRGVDVGRAKMMHDFAATRSYTILLNLPLTLAPSNLFSLHPVPLIHFDRTLPSEFVVFPRLLGSERTPQSPVHFRLPEPSMIFHTANAWDEVMDGQVKAVNMLACRFKSAKLVYAAGAIDVPDAERAAGDDDVVQLWYYRFVLPIGYQSNSHDTLEGEISHACPLTAIPFEFPSVPTELGMSKTQFVYGCTMRSGSFDERLGGAAKVDCLAKIDVGRLIQAAPPLNDEQCSTPVDGRSASRIIEDWTHNANGPVEIFALPPGCFAQEARFVPRSGDDLDEDHGYLLTYEVYDESQNLLPNGSPSTGADCGSELWIIDAKRMGDGMNAVICRIKLPQRVPYGLHGVWLPAASIRQQRVMMEDDLSSQALLQDKLSRSRLQNFASILFDRPFHRKRSLPETIFLYILWPSAIFFLLLAIFVGMRHALALTRPSLTPKHAHSGDDQSFIIPLPQARLP